MKSLSLTAFPRTESKRTGSKKVRARGRVPAILYGGGGDPHNIEVESKDLVTAIKRSITKNFLVDLEMNGSKYLTLVQEIQKHPIRGSFLHVDFLRVSEDRPVSATIPVEATGTPEGVKVGGVLQYITREIRLNGRPSDLPDDKIQVDVTHLKVGQALKLGDIPTPEGVKVMGDPNAPAIAVTGSRITAKESQEQREAEARSEKEKDEDEE